MQDYLTYLASALLDCGYGDLSVLKNCAYDFTDLIENCKDGFGTINLNTLCRTMFEMGMTEIQDSIGERIEQLQEELKDIDDTETNNETEEMRDELANLLKLKPFDDIESYHNFLDTSIYFVNNSDIYNSYCSHELETFENNTGYSINN